MATDQLMTCANCDHVIDVHEVDAGSVELYGTTGYAHFTPDPNDPRRGFYTPADHPVISHPA